MRRPQPASLLLSSALAGCSPDAAEPLELNWSAHDDWVEVDLADTSYSTYAGCGVREGGEALCWGGNYDVYELDWELSGLSVHPRRACGLLEEGGGRSVLCVDADGQAERYPGDYVDVTAGEDFACAVSSSGALQCWGDQRALEVIGYEGLAAEGAFTRIDTYDEVELDFEGYKEGQALCGLREDGTLLCQGNTLPNSCDTSEVASRWRTLRGYIDFTADRCRVYAISEGGRLHGWTDGSVDEASSFAPDRELARVSAGPNVSSYCLLDREGGLWCHLAAGLANLFDESDYAPEDPALSFQAVSAADDLGCGVTRDGRLACWPMRVDPLLDYGNLPP